MNHGKFSHVQVHPPDHTQISAQNGFQSRPMAGHASDCTIDCQNFVFKPDAATRCLLSKAHQLPFAASCQKAAAAGLKAGYRLLAFQFAALAACHVAAAWCNLQQVGACGALQGFRRQLICTCQVQIPSFLVWPTAFDWGCQCPWL